uniref:Uncharacterized protein n=2 Tax=Tetranychus urticae TaxID=32264 RepID=T1L2I6_TETUR
MDTQIVNLHSLYNRSSCKNSLLVLAASSAVLCSAIMLAALWTVRVASRKNNAI